MIVSQAARGQSSGRKSLSGEVPAGCSAFCEDGTRNAEPHIDDGQVSAHTTDRKMGQWVMRALHRHRRRGLQLQTRRFPFSL